MFAARSYLLKAGPKSVQSSDGRKETSDTTPRTIPAVENVRSFGWRPDSYKGSKAVDGAKREEQEKRKSAAKGEGCAKSAGAKALKNDQTTRPQLQRRDLTSDLFPNRLPEVSSPLPRSQPVPVPKRQHASRPSSPRSSRSSGKTASLNGGSVISTSDSKTNKHDPNSTAPAVAALLAMTSIPKRRSFPKTRPQPPGTTPKKMSAQELMEEWKLEDVVVGSTPESSSPNMGLLLSPPDEDEELLSRSSKGELEERQFRERSTSTDSIPSLATDDSTSLSFSFSSPTSSFLRRQVNEKRERTSSPKSVDATSAHPLTAQPKTESDAFEDEDLASPLPAKLTKFSSTAAPKPYRRKSSPPGQQSLMVGNQKQNRSLSTSILKSNLTASLAALRSAARSVSNFAGPSIPPDDYLSRNFFTVPYTAERRPKPIQGVPTPELRRYLNPPHPTVKGGPMYDFHLHGSHVDHTDLEAIAAAAAAAAHLNSSLSVSEGGLLGQKSSSPLSTYPAYTFTPGGEPITAIPLETYHSNVSAANGRGGKHGNRRSSGGGGGGGSSSGGGKSIHDGNDSSIMPTTEAGLLQAQRAREPRENSDFLRVCVLEMRMRRAGKLEPGAPGRARVWLPPRPPPAFSAGSAPPSPRLKSSRHRASSGGGVATMAVNQRWQGISAEY